MVKKHQLSCCALCQMTADNNDSLLRLSSMVDKIKADSKKVWNTQDRASGERAIFTIVSPGEDKLATRLEILGFKPITKFNRRNGYPQTGLLEMWFLNF